MKTTFAAALIGTTALLSSTAFAQTPRLVEVDDNVTVQPFNLAAGLLDDIDVYTAEGMEVGDVEKVVGPDRQNPTHFVVDFDDDTEYPEGDYLIELGEFSLDGDRLVISLVPAEISLLPVWDD